MNAVSQWWIGGLRTRKAKVAGSIPAGGSKIVLISNLPKAQVGELEIKVNFAFLKVVR